jgi:hypothetical protein
VTPDGKQVTSAGRVASCLECHRRAPHDRLFGAQAPISTPPVPDVRLEPLQGSQNAPAWPRDWSKYLGRSITLEGKAANAKQGAVLLGDGDEIWIDGLEAWPDGFYLGGDDSKRVRVTGTVIERSDAPAFRSHPGEAPRQGIPVPEGTDLSEAQKRFLLKDATWRLVE